MGSNGASKPRGIKIRASNPAIGSRVNNTTATITAANIWSGMLMRKKAALKKMPNSLKAITIIITTTKNDKMSILSPSYSLKMFTTGSHPMFQLFFLYQEAV